MDALLILSGLLLILVGLVWLVMLAFDTSLLWGLGSLLPPLTLVYVLRHWRKARKAVVLGAMGFIPLIVGLTLLANQDPQRLQAILSLDWARSPVQAPAELAIHLRGSLNGQPFEWVADADSRLGPVMEAIINGRYYWVPFARLAS